MSRGCVVSGEGEGWDDAGFVAATDTAVIALGAGGALGGDGNHGA